MRKIKLQENEGSLEAVIYDIFLYGKSDSMMMTNIKNEYDNVIGKSLIMAAVDRLELIVDINDIINQFRKYKIKVV